MKILSQKFFNRPTLTVARELLGKFLVRRIGKKKTSAVIAEVEAYAGPKDEASHAFKGRTKRTELMFGKAGYWYVYLVYGMHYCLNIVTEKKDYPAAILIRAVVLQKEAHLRNTRVGSGNKGVFKNRGGVSEVGFFSIPNSLYFVRGPGRVTKFFKIDQNFNGKPALPRTGLWIEDKGIRLKLRQIGQGKRIGVDYARKWKHKPWKFCLTGLNKI